MTYVFFPPDFFSKSHSHPTADSTQSSDNRISLHSLNENSGFVKHKGFQFSGVNQTQSLEGSLHCCLVVISSHVGDSEVSVTSASAVVVVSASVVVVAGSVEGVDCNSPDSSSFIPLEVNIVSSTVAKVDAEKSSHPYCESNGLVDVLTSGEDDATTTVTVAVAVVDGNTSNTSSITD